MYGRLWEKSENKPLLKHAYATLTTDDNFVQNRCSELSYLPLAPKKKWPINHMLSPLSLLPIAISAFHEVWRVELYINRLSARLPNLYRNGLYFDYLMKLHKDA